MENQLAGDSEHAFSGKGHMMMEREELYKLRKENKRLRLKHEIFKKAAAFLPKIRWLIGDGSRERD